MGKTSWQVKKKYNDKTYGRISADIPKELAEQFKARCKENGVSIASVIQEAVEDYLQK